MEALTRLIPWFELHTPLFTCGPQQRTLFVEGTFIAEILTVYLHKCIFFVSLVLEL